MEQVAAPERMDGGAPAGRYFADGADLYRLVGWLGRWLEAMLAELEDCRSLDILRDPGARTGPRDAATVSYIAPPRARHLGALGSERR
ncbi:MAG: hypothetical protein ACXVHB_31870 [Solirubrobacteraceae bacterium]